jgi:hypothetical protein
MTTTPNANRKTASKKTTRRIARKLTSTFTRKPARAISRRKQLEMKAALERHSRRCIICHHPEREAIEEEFLHWRAPWKLAEDYNLADYRTIYRHARAAGLLLQRRENLHSGLDAFVEAVDDVKFTGDTILRAMRAYSCIDRHGRWTEIPTRVSISTFKDVRPAQSPAPYPEDDSDVIDIEPEQLDEDPEEDEEEYDDPEDDEEDLELDERSASDQTACAVSPAQAVPKLPSDSGRGRKVTATACAASPRTSRGSPAQAFSVTEGNSDDDDPEENDEEEEYDEEDSEPAAFPQAAPQPPGRRATATACADPPAQDSAHNAAPESAPAPQSAAMQHSNPASRGDSTACAAPPAQPAPHAYTWQNPLPPPAPLTDYPPVYPIYGPAIKNHRKTRYFSSLRFSNRR